jgi:hypothetical protein
MTNDSRPPDDLNSSAAPVPPTRPERRVSGRAIVLGMLAFGTLTTATMWVYWTLHVGPFRPLQDAIAAAFPQSSPRVDGGQRKMHKGTPKILRIVMRVDFDPVVETSRGEEVVTTVEQIAGEYLDLNQYEELDVYLYQGVPEQIVKQQEYTRTLRPAGTSTKPEKVSQNTRP